MDNTQLFSPSLLEACDQAFLFSLQIKAFVIVVIHDAVVFIVDFKPTLANWREKMRYIYYSTHSSYIKAYSA